MADIGGKDSKRRKIREEINKREQFVKNTYKKMIELNKNEPNNDTRNFVLKLYDEKYNNEKLEKQRHVDALQKIVAHLDNLMEDSTTCSESRKKINDDLVQVLNKTSEVKKDLHSITH